MGAVLLATLAGASFGCLTVAVQWGIRRGGDPYAGAFVAAAIGAIASAAVAIPAIALEGVRIEELLPFLGAGLVAPGASQIFLTLAVRHAGSSRAAILMGAAPLISIVMAWILLDEVFRPLALVGTVLIVLGTIALAGERTRPDHFRARGVVLALLCAVLFAVRDTTVRWAARDVHPPPLVAATASLLAAAALILAYLVVARRHRLRTRLRQTVPAFAPAGIAVALGYDALLAALDRGPVSIVSPLNATGSLWAVVFATLLIGREEHIGLRIPAAALLVVAGGMVVGMAR